MNICHVITRLIVGGAQENTVLTCRGLVERGHRVSLLAGPETGPEGSLWDEAQKAGCELHPVDTLRRAVNPWHDLRALRELRRYFQGTRPDIVHTHSSKAGILARAAAAGAGVPVIIHTIHGMSFNRTQFAPTRMLYSRLERWAAKRTTSFVTVADAMIDQAVAAGVAPRNRFKTIYSGMETSRFAPDMSLRRRLRDSWGIGEGEIVVGTVARLFKNKGYEEILAAMPAAVARDPRLKFVWIGDGASRAAYEHELVKMGLRNRVHLLGLVDPCEIGACMNGFDLVLHASRWEGLPRAIVQGLLTEIPAVSFDNDGAPEVVIPGRTGILVPLGDSSGLIDAILTLAADPDLRRRLGAQGRIVCLEQFCWRGMVEQIEALYTELLPPGSKVVPCAAH